MLAGMIDLHTRSPSVSPGFRRAAMVMRQSLAPDRLAVKRRALTWTSNRAPNAGVHCAGGEWPLPTSALRSVGRAGPWIRIVDYRHVVASRIG
jgi:hypothetical protein